ncbi:hypothetical protein G9C85_13275 [Halorubellus sp. JP-L1]|nr:hypothetical protein [Halorubellus sp. JP-L1]NHN42592.1 hypothetical protein [Halorubellus sp. JP-L1]
MNVDRSEFDHPTWISAGATAAGYAVLLAVMTVLLFGVPYLLFLALG